MKRLALTFALGIVVILNILPSAAGAWGRHGRGVVVIVGRPSPVVIVRPSTVVARPSAGVIVPQRVEVLVPPVRSHLLAVPSINRRFLATGCCVEFFPDPGWFFGSYTPLVAYPPAQVSPAPPPPVVYLTPVPTEPDLAYVPPRLLSLQYLPLAERSLARDASFFVTSGFAGAAEATEPARSEITHRATGNPSRNVLSRLGPIGEIEPPAMLGLQNPRARSAPVCLLEALAEAPCGRKRGGVPLPII